MVRLPDPALAAALVLAVGSALAGATARSSTDRVVLDLLGESMEDWAVHWTERLLRDEPTRYAVVDEEGDVVLRARSEVSASVVWRELDLGRIERGRLSWRWKVERSLPNTESEREVAGDDYAARVFIFFGPKLSSRKTRAICYVWASREPVGEIYPNPYSERIGTMVLETGNGRAGQWVTESRDLVADFRAIFGMDPDELAAVALLVDTDDTGLAATAWFDDLTLDMDPEHAGQGDSP